MFVDSRHRVVAWLVLPVLVAIASGACDDTSGADEGGALEGHWSGSMVCEGSYAYSMGFNLDGEGEVSGVDITSKFLSSMCPGGSGIIACGGSGDYTYSESGRKFTMDVDYSDCTCGGVKTNILDHDSFDGTFDGSGTLAGDVGCEFTFHR